MNIFNAIFLSIFISISITNCAPTAPLVTTKLGKIKGVLKTLDDGKEVNLFYGIPYAKPPVGELRFSKPEPVSPWDGVYEATKARHSCPQVIGSLTEEAPIGEDCLFLSVWQPNTPSTDGKKRSGNYRIN
jgi:carboxylesterase type B